VGPDIKFHEDVHEVFRRRRLPRAREVGGDPSYAAEWKSSIPANLALGFPPRDRNLSEGAAGHLNRLAALSL
jgi:hypothetical protein